MSTETIARKAVKRPAKKKTPKLSVDLINERYTGEEPVWDGWQDWTVAEFYAEHGRALNYYSYHNETAELKPYVIEWMEANGYDSKLVDAVKAAPDYSPGRTTGALCRCLLRGMPGLHPQASQYWEMMPGLIGEPTSDVAFVTARIADAITLGHECMKEAKTAETADAPKSATVNPQDRLRAKVTATVIQDLDVLLDSWNLPRPESEPLPTMDIYASIRKHEIAPLGFNTIIDWLGRHRLEMELALSGEDEYLVETYAFLTKKRLQERIRNIAQMMDDVAKARSSAKAQRAPRAKKIPAATKQIEKLKYLKDSPEFKITSVNPIRVVGAYRLLAFNTKYRTLIDYVAQSELGIQIKGTSFKNLDESLCKQIKLRKPDEVLQVILNGTARQIDNAWSKLTTKESKPNGRCNEEIILVRVFEQKP